MKILITGGSGQVGFELQRTLALFGEILAPSQAELELTDLSAVSQYLKLQQPDLIVNAAAHTAVDKAESEPELAYLLNTELPKLFADYSRDHDSWLVHFSTDYVYDGSGTAPREETAATAPLSVYGASKLAGDQAIQNSGSLYFIFRTSWVYGSRGHNFVKTMLRLGAERETLNIVNDQIGAPTTARLIAEVTAQAVAQRHVNKQGLYHLTCVGECSWHTFAQEIFKQASCKGIPLKISLENVFGIPTSQYPTPAKRPLNSRLKVNKLEQQFNLKLPDWKEQLALVLAEINAE